MATRGFIGRRPRQEIATRVPPGQHETTEFPVLSIGPTPLIDMAKWSLSIRVEQTLIVSWQWDEFNALDLFDWTGDIHCVTRWSKFDTQWSGVSIDTMLETAGLKDPPPYCTAVSMDGYSSNLLTSDLADGRAMVATHYEGKPLDRHHGGPARLFAPHLYFWKSAKWICELNFSNIEKPGFWESRGYHLYGDPWREQRFIEGE
ncbi:molybdopterin-dependent oxidoreductase [Burkholderia sp. Ac-20353]|nr:molybdopterin-dependent oxidoreductase [Burkholderia sp. Ac-20353]